MCAIALRWRRNERDGVSNHQPHDYLLNHLFRHRSKKHQSSALLAFVRGIHRSPVNSPHEGPVTWKCFRLMTSSWPNICSTLINHLKLRHCLAHWTNGNVVKLEICERLVLKTSNLFVPLYCNVSYVCDIHISYEFTLFSWNVSVFEFF